VAAAMRRRTRPGIIVACAAALLSTTMAAHAAAPQGGPEAKASGGDCGAVRGSGKGRNASFRVVVTRGRIGCRSARRVIKHVLTHGRSTQGSIGAPLRGWSCGWGYGIYHHDQQQYGRAGPSCSRTGTTVQGYAPGYTPATRVLAARAPMIGTFNTDAVYKPRHFCPANHTCFRNVQWHKWGTSASATAEGHTQYPAGRPFSGKASVVLYRVRHMCGGARYTRARWRYRGDSTETRTLYVKEGSVCFWTGA
jgi:hypothetical protein